MPDTSKFLLILTDTGEWILHPAGADNSSIDNANLLRRTVNELTECITAHPDELDRTLLQAFKDLSQKLRRPIEI